MILGGAGVIGTTVERLLHSYAGSVVRYAGINRYATAATVSARTFAPGVGVAYIATGGGFADALAGAAAAGTVHGPVLLATANSLPAATAAELNRLRPAEDRDPRRCRGHRHDGRAAASQLRRGGVVRYAGINRYATRRHGQCQDVRPGCRWSPTSTTGGGLRRRPRREAAAAGDGPRPGPARHRQRPASRDGRRAEPAQAREDRDPRRCRGVIGTTVERLLNPYSNGLTASSPTR